ncbi:DUF169 domain-containing protein [Tepidibacter hydrothermalis]|uniref:DUF169 domain-containing protein n=1 Tax=Tepidibacter hydrothermalis TaxID=3036126 RepID=A0ABY8E9G2_9FIRM|nr:DUF169 domain-containing protein [Tepidibacter hydrothermalis]WFD09545.1 DUF169 domain-containing protein [Tepidibacter hydrothermalis]
MKSKIVNALKPELETIALLRSNTKPEGAIQPTPGKYVCIMSLFAQVATKGKVVVFDRDTYGCPGAKAGLGFGSAYGEAMGGYDTFAAFFSKGLEDAKDKDKYLEISNNANVHVRKKLIEGERFHTSREKAYKWITQDLPLYDFPEKYVILKPLKDVTEDEKPQSIIFTVNPIQLTALMTLTGSIREGVNDTITPQGAACQMIGSFVFKEMESDNPRAVLGMIDLAARKTVRNILPDNVLTYAVPWKLFLDLEEEAEEGIFKSPLWLDLFY